MEPSAMSECLKAVCVFTGVAISWACSTQFAKSALVIDVRHFYAPYFMVWFSTNFMILCYPIFLLYTRIFEGRGFRASNEDALRIFGDSTFRWRLFFARELPFIVLWVAANYSYSQALGHISASAASSVISSNTCVVCLLGWIMLKEPLSGVKLLAVFMAIAGVVVISFDKEFSGSLLGILLATLCAVSAAFYKVLFKYLNGDANLGQVSVFMTGLGLINLTLNIVPTIVLNALDVDHIEWGYVPWFPVIASSLLSLSFNFFVNFGIALLNPLVISVGMLLGLPLSAAIDIIFRDITLTLRFAAGALLILISFTLAAFPIERWICGRANDGGHHKAPQATTASNDESGEKKTTQGKEAVSV